MDPDAYEASAVRLGRLTLTHECLGRVGDSQHPSYRKSRATHGRETA